LQTVPCERSDPPDDALAWELVRDDLVAGLAHRIGGWCKEALSEVWNENTDERIEPWTLSPELLSSDKVAALLAPAMTDLRLDEEDDSGFSFRCGGVAVAAWKDATAHAFPLVRRQPWFVSWEQTAVYRCMADTDDDVARAAMAARTLRDATGGELLDWNGFEWVDPPHRTWPGAAPL
jgi:hypothetical protein